LQVLGFDTEKLKVFLLNMVLANIRDSMGTYDSIKNIDPEEFAESILRSAVIMDEDSKIRARKSFEKLSALRQKKLGEKNRDRTDLI
jgi:hypothetical protein